MKTNPSLDPTYISFLDSLDSCDYAILGGLALIAHTRILERGLADLDVAIFSQDSAKVTALLKALGFRRGKTSPNTHLAFLRKSESSRLIMVHVVIDSLKVLDKDLKRIEFAYPLTHCLSYPERCNFGSLEIKLIPKEDLLVLKMIPYFASGGNERHLEDIDVLLSNCQSLQLRYIKAIIWNNDKLKERLSLNSSILMKRFPNLMPILPKGNGRN
jgi:hypothetical protein